MALALKSGEVHKTRKNVEISTGFIVLTSQNIKERTFLLGVFIDQETYETAASSNNEENMTLEVLRVQMTVPHFITYLYSDVTFTGKPLDLLNKQFFTYILTEKPLIQGGSPFHDWDQWELALVPGVPFSVPNEKNSRGIY